MRRVKTSSNIQTVLLLVSTVLLLTLVVFPLITLFGKAFEGRDGSFAGFANFIRYFSFPNFRASVNNSIYISTVTTIIAVFFGFFYAYAIKRTGIKGKTVLKFSAMLPLFAPTMMLGIGLIYLFGNQGLITSLGVKLPLYGSFGIITAETVYVFPQVVLIMLVSFSHADNRLYEAADVMGTSPLKKFFTITLPSVKYGLISSTFVAFSLSFTDFGAPKVVGGNFNVLATDIFRHVVGQFNFVMGAVVGILLMTPAVLSFIVDRLTQSKNQYTVTSKTVDFIIKPHKGRDNIYTFYCVVINIIIFTLFGTVVFASMIRLWPYDLSLTLQYYFKDHPSLGGISSYINSITVALLTAIIGTVLVFINAYLVEKTRNAKLLRQTSYFLSLLPLALPGLAIGIAFIFFFTLPGNPMNILFGSMWILVVANLVHFYSVPFVTATSSLKKLDKEFETVSESMQVPFYKTFFKVSLPMCAPAILEILVYFFVNSMVTVSAVIFLYPPHFRLASVAITNMEEVGESARAAALSVLIVLTNIAVRGLYELINRYLLIRKNRYQKITEKMEEIND
ncbi:MAG: putative 2-aminoethylphosphonate ABC transporter permease subunit [Treponema sp.]|jgi:iron(III) transport system permease protein|nr:putative 2-aminoethylphosphonate ABC transporter permease subunit [Treponema sp.]